SVPYYFNIAPNYDATLRTTYLQERGLQFFGEFRHLNTFGDSVLKLEYLPQDELFKDDARHAFALDVNQNFSNGFGLRIDLQDVSDTSYLNDFRNDISLSSSTHLPQRVDVNYSNSLFYMRGKAAKYVAVTPNLTASNPYDRLPQVAFGLRSQDFGPFRLNLDAEYVAFKHDDNAKLSGTRFNFTPAISMPITPIYGFLKPKIAYRTLSYQLDNVSAGSDDAPSASAPIFSIDSGVFLERDITWGGEPMLQTLEPRAMYVYIPEDNQDDMPVFDTGEGSVSSYSYLFREDRFFGGDRIGDDHHIALGLTSRIIDDESGKERFKASIGQLYYLEDREVGLSAGAAATESKSDIFADARANLTDTVDISSSLRWDQSEGELSTLNMGVGYKNGSRRSASVNYYKYLESSEDLRLKLNWPLSPRVQLRTNQLYSIKDSVSRSSSLGLVYDGCCWAVGLTASRRLISGGEYRNSILATLELDGLGKIQTTR
ncbi:MAG: LPS-assembly protein LptD, partial [Arenicellales bacterium]